jgi:hypothetical protein
MIDRNLRVIFVHIQKTGGTSIVRTLGHAPGGEYKHWFAKDLRDVYGGDVWSECFSFAFVRNPWDRLVSWWSMIEAKRGEYSRGGEVNAFYRFVLSNARNFEEFLKNCDQEILDRDGRKWIFRNQLDYIVDDDGKILVDFVGKFENMAADFALVSARIFGDQRQLPNLNASAHQNYREYYTPALAQMVGERFKNDIEAFGFAF